MTRDKNKINPRARQAGHAAVEIALMAPWIFLIVMAVFDFGFYAYSIIAVANAARVGALHTSGAPASAGASDFACAYAVEELRMLPNVGPGTTCSCGGGSGATCTAGPITVVARFLNGAGGVPFGADGEPASEVSVTYQSPQLFPLPWLMGRLTITRVVQVKV